MSHMKAATACIDLQALQHNLHYLKKLAPNSRLMAVVKANAYGHGLRQIAQYATVEADGFAVARIEEALEIRNAGIDKPITLLEGFYSPQDLPVLVKHQIDTVIHCKEQLEAIESTPLSRPINIWLKIDTGMHRLGVEPSAVKEYVKRLSACVNVAPPIRFISHFACADETENDFTQTQIDRFDALTTAYPGECSLAASAGILAWPQSHLDWIRPGIIMYGLSPFSDKTSAQLNVKPVMTLKSHIIAVHRLKKGERVGYGRHWQAPIDTNIAIVAIGYGDGYPRTAPNGTPVWVNGRRVPIAGRVSMDMLSIDLGPDGCEQVGDEVILWGNELPAEEVAQYVGTIAYELITKLTTRVELEYLTA